MHTLCIVLCFTGYGIDGGRASLGIPGYRHRCMHFWPVFNVGHCIGRGRAFVGKLALVHVGGLKRLGRVPPGYRHWTLPCTCLGQGGQSHGPVRCKHIISCNGHGCFGGHDVQALRCPTCRAGPARCVPAPSDLIRPYCTIPLPIRSAQERHGNCPCCLVLLRAPLSPRTAVDS